MFVKSGGGPLALTAGVTLPVTPGGRLRVSGQGFEPTAQVRSYLLSGPHSLGALMTDFFGEVEGDLTVPPALAVGDDALQINGFTRDREVRSVSLGVRVMQSSELRVMQTKLRFARHSSHLTKASEKELRSMMALLSTRKHSSTTITGVYFPPRGAMGRALARDRSALVNDYLREIGLGGIPQVIIKPTRPTDHSRGRRVVVRAYYSEVP